MKQTNDRNRGIIASIIGVLAFVFLLGVIFGKVVADRTAHKEVYKMRDETDILLRRVNEYNKTTDSIKKLYKNGLPKRTAVGGTTSGETYGFTKPPKR